MYPQVVPRPVGWTNGPEAPWPDGFAPSVDALVAAARPIDPTAALDGLAAAPSAEVRFSAVLVALATTERGPELLLTRRSLDLRSHPGEVSFPGGRVDRGETPVAAALREAEEEVGLDRLLPTVHGEIDHVTTFKSASYIVPVVATVPAGLDLGPGTMEVDRLFWTPLERFTQHDVYHSERWVLDGFTHPDVVLHFFDLGDELVWGATAQILVDLLTATMRLI